jgi:hypothetical protein
MSVVANYDCKLRVDETKDVVATVLAAAETYIHQTTYPVVSRQLTASTAVAANNVYSGLRTLVAGIESIDFSLLGDVFSGLTKSLVGKKLQGFKIFTSSANSAPVVFKKPALNAYPFGGGVNDQVSLGPGEEFLWMCNGNRDVIGSVTNLIEVISTDLDAQYQIILLTN